MAFDPTSSQTNCRVVGLLCVLALAGAPSAFAGPGGTQNPGIALIQSHPHGKSYAEWAASWWKWALGTPANVHPLINKGGCEVDQAGGVWFLAGNPFSTDPINRACTVVVGTALFFPVINLIYGAFLNDPLDTRTEAFLRAQVSCEPATITASIDGVAVKVPTQYFETSPLFDVQLPADNLFGLGPDVIPQLLLSPSVGSGYYLFLRPLEPGVHEIHWNAAQTYPSGPLSQDVTYTFTVARSVPGRHDLP